MPRLSVARVLAALALIIATCANTPAPSANPITVITSISTFNSFVTAVGGSHVTVRSLVPIGASPEDYQPTPQDVEALSKAQLLVENGAGLESWLARTIANTGSKNLKIVTCTNGLPVKNSNPHLWMDPQFAKHYVAMIRDGLIEIDPANAADYRKNAGTYMRKLDDLTKSIASRINSIPQARRVMIVQHNAWQYYNDRFGIKTLGFIEINPGQEPNPQQIAHLIDLAKQYDAHAIFSEPEYSPKLAEQIANNANIKIVDNLYDDSIGSDPRVSDYISMLNYDTAVIVKALR
jgi:ABC-type Zn uptake system ZnuABC Zn-binding protein ZnuA